MTITNFEAMQEFWQMKDELLTALNKLFELQDDACDYVPTTKLIWRIEQIDANHPPIGTEVEK